MEIGDLKGAKADQGAIRENYVLLMNPISGISTRCWNEVPVQIFVVEIVHCNQRKVSRTISSKLDEVRSVRAMGLRAMQSRSVNVGCNRDIHVYKGGPTPLPD